MKRTSKPVDGEEGRRSKRQQDIDNFIIKLYSAKQYCRDCGVRLNQIMDAWYDRSKPFKFGLCSKCQSIYPNGMESTDWYYEYHNRR